MFIPIPATLDQNATPSPANNASNCLPDCSSETTYKETASPKKVKNIPTEIERPGVIFDSSPPDFKHLTEKNTTNKQLIAANNSATGTRNP